MGIIFCNVYATGYDHIVTVRANPIPLRIVTDRNTRAPARAVPLYQDVWRSGFKHHPPQRGASLHHKTFSYIFGPLYIVLFASDLAVNTGNAALDIGDEVGSV